MKAQTTRGVSFPGSPLEKAASCLEGVQNCYRLSNGIVDLMITTDVARVIRFGFVNEENEFKEYEDMLGKTGGEEWRIYGGHRLWHAPEEKPRTYFPDNVPVEWEQHPGFVRVIQPTEMTTGIQKELFMSLRDTLTQENRRADARTCSGLAATPPPTSGGVQRLFSEGDGPSPVAERGARRSRSPAATCSNSKPSVRSSAFHRGRRWKHTEQWFLFKDVPVLTNEANVEKHVLPKVQAVRG